MTVERTVAAKTPDNDLLALPLEERATLRVLIVEDDQQLREGLLSTIRLEGYNVSAAASGMDALKLLSHAVYDIILTDLYMSPVGGIDVLRAAHRVRRDTIVIILTGNPTLTASLDALRAGAWDFLPTPFSAAHIQLLLGRAAHAVLQTRVVRTLRAEIDRLAIRGDEPSLIGTSPAILDALRLARKVAATDAPVLLMGESGTGKELFAHFIHGHSRRNREAFIPVNCAALPEPLLESEMFGYRRGAFTGAEHDRQGLLESAHHGTMFLDELAEMPITLQAKLLRVLQDGVVRRVGSTQSDAVVDVRFISAMNRDPQTAVAEGKLREDLLYRLRVFPIRIPPLRERRDDIVLLATHFLATAWIRHRVAGTTMPKLTQRSLHFLRAQPWRGNVRELRNVIEHVAVLADAGQEIEPEHIPLAQHSASDTADFNASLPSDVLREPFRVAKERFVSDFERLYLRRLVDTAGGNLARAARIANVDRTTLYRLIEKHHIGVQREVVAENLK